MSIYEFKHCVTYYEIFYNANMFQRNFILDVAICLIYSITFAVQGKGICAAGSYFCAVGAGSESDCGTARPLRCRDKAHAALAFAYLPMPLTLNVSTMHLMQIW